MNVVPYRLRIPQSLLVMELLLQGKDFDRLGGRMAIRYVLRLVSAYVIDRSLRSNVFTCTV